MQLSQGNVPDLLLPNSAEARDVAFLLHPYTDAKKHAENGPLMIERGEGIHVIDSSGNRYIEAMSGLWSVGVGFTEKRLADVAYQQMLQLPYSHIFAGRSHNPAVDLAEKLMAMTSAWQMQRAFFTNSGSEANDTVLKFLWYRSNALGEPSRKKIISRHGAYHGTTVAAACLTGLPVNHHSFDMIVPDVIRLTSPHHYRNAEVGESQEAFAERLAKELEQAIVDAGPDNVCAMFGEPLMGAAGVVVPPETYWERMQEVLRRYGIILVADEVITGFGRTGQMFGCETFDITPDVMVLSKQLSSSYLPISAILMNAETVGPIEDETGRIGVLGHGFTTSAHPVCSRVALENIAIIEERNLVENARQVGHRLQDGLTALCDHPLVGEVRGKGLIGALELVTDKAAKTALAKPGQLAAVAQQHLLANGVISRSIGDAQCFCPPLVISSSEVDDLLSRVRKALDETAADIGIAT